MGKIVAYLGPAAAVCLALDIESDTGTYLEIGAHKGRSMMFLADNLITKIKKLHLIGYDVFDLETDNFHLQEDNGMLGGNFNECFNNLTQMSILNPNISFDLVKGYTKDTLQPTKVDWAYIDGGHSYETVKWDHEQLKDSRIIIFDDSDLPGVNRYLWEIKDQYNIYSLYETDRSPKMAYHRQAVIINDMDNFKFDTVKLEKFQGHDPETYVSLRKV
jgi:Methyltransferase domain